MSAGVPWSAAQCEWLQALGHDVHRFAAIPDDPLVHAVLRAAGHDPADAAARRVLARLPPVASLRGDAGAKRRLWPTLRALRPRHG